MDGQKRILQARIEESRRRVIAAQTRQPKTEPPKREAGKRLTTYGMLDEMFKGSLGKE